MATRKLNIFIHCYDGTGHLNATIGLGQELASRGHNVSFLLNQVFKGKVSLFGLREVYLIDTPKVEPTGAPDPTVNPVKKVAEALQASGLLSGVNSLEKIRIENTDHSFMEDIYRRAVVFNPQIEKFITAEKPDLIILDHFLIPPAIPQSAIPYVLMESGNPLHLYHSKQLPPAFSGYSTTSDPANWEEFFGELQNFATKVFGKFQSRLNEKFNFKPTGEMNNCWGFAQSPYLNIYGYPEELDYQDLVPLPENVISVDAFCRKLPKPFKIPESLMVQPGDKLIYVSMGSMGSIDVELNKRIASVLAKTPYKVIFSKGPLADEYELPDNCWGEAHLPQTSILPLVDLCITHGGNNSVTETFSFGVPMIVLPLFGDQFDNAQRIQEKSYGVRLEPYHFTERQLLEAVDKLLHDETLKQRLKTAAKRIEDSKSKQRACERMGRLVEESRKLI